MFVSVWISSPNKCFERTPITDASLLGLNSGAAQAQR